MRATLFFLIPLSVALSAVSLNAAENLVRNPGFESGLDGWRVWARKPDAITANLEERNVHSGRNALRLEHTADQDWSLEPALRLRVRHR